MKKGLIILAAIALVGAFATTTLAADWNMYGHARFATYYQSLSKENPGNPMATNFSDSDTLWHLQNNARIGANVDAGDIKGRFELGTNPNATTTSAPAGETIYLRLLYADYMMGDSGSFRVGQSYAPASWTHYSNSVFGDDGDLFGWGGQYAGRVQLLQWAGMGFKVALIRPNIIAAPAGAPAADTDITLPKIEVAYKYSADMWWLDLVGGWQSVDYVAANDQSKGLTAYIAAVGAGFNFGPGQIKGSLSYKLNGTAYGSSWAGNDPIVWDATKADFADTTSFGGQLIGVYKASDMITFEIGGGVGQHEVDATGAKVENQVYQIYAQLPITVADGFVITPEVGVQDLGDLDNKSTGVKTKQGNTTYFGAKWQINF